MYVVLEVIEGYKKEGYYWNLEIGLNVNGFGEDIYDGWEYCFIYNGYDDKR